MNTASAPNPGSEPLSRRVRYGWVLELAAMVAVYVGYDALRDRVAGSGPVAFEHATQVVSLESTLGIGWERSIQHPFLHLDWFMAFWNIFYGTVHFVVPVIALVWLYRKAPERYARWRTTLVFMFAIALLSFWVYPLMPPRLMPAHYGFVDTAAHYFNFGPQVHVRFLPNGQPTAKSVAAFGNLFAAMPSFHVGWSTWSVLAMWPLARSRWLKAFLLAYPLLVVFGITVTANHWLLDAVGGWVVLGLGYACAVALERIQLWLRDARGWHRRSSGDPLSSGAPNS
jgi:hypothetical protein